MMRNGQYGVLMRVLRRIAWRRLFRFCAIGVVIVGVWAAGSYFALRESVAPPPGAVNAAARISGAVTDQTTVRLEDCAPFESFNLPITVYRPGVTPATRALLYFPGWGGTAQDNRRLLRALAKQGYAIFSLPDVRAWPLRDSTSPLLASAVAADFAIGSFNDRASFRAIADRRTAVATRGAQCFLDRLKGGDVASRVAGMEAVSSDRVGVFGFSFGGAVAAELHVLRTDIAASANIDGWIYGHAFAADTLAPHLWIHSDHPRWTLPDVISRLMPARHFVHAYENDTQRRVAHLAQNRDFHTVYVDGATHGDLSDELFTVDRRRSWRPWFQPRPASEVTEILDRYLAEFFQTYLPTSEDGADRAAIGLLSARAPTFRGTRITPVAAAPAKPKFEANR